MGIVVLRGNCPTNKSSCPIGIIVLSSRCPEWVLVLGVNWQRGSCPREIIVL